MTCGRRRRALRRALRRPRRLPAGRRRGGARRRLPVLPRGCLAWRAAIRWRSSAGGCARGRGPERQSPRIEGSAPGPVGQAGGGLAVALGCRTGCPVRAAGEAGRLGGERWSGPPRHAGSRLACTRAASARAAGGARLAHRSLGRPRWSAAVRVHGGGLAGCSSAVASPPAGLWAAPPPDALGDGGPWCAVSRRAAQVLGPLTTAAGGGRLVAMGARRAGPVWRQRRPTRPRGSCTQAS